MCGSSALDVGAGVTTSGFYNLAKSGMPDAPGAPTLPKYPDLTPEEQANLAKQGQGADLGSKMIGNVANQTSQNSNILNMISGLFKSDGSIDQNALAQLQQTANQSNSMAAQQGMSSLAGIGGTNSSLAATQAAYTNALNGNAPANKQLQYQQDQSFQQMREQAAQQGIQINGTNFQNAVSDSTAGQKLLQNFQQNANIQNQNYQLGYVNQLGSNMSQIAGVGQTQANTGMGLSSYSQQTPLSYLNQSVQNQSALSPILSDYQNQLSSAYQPLYMQQIGPYQQAMAQAQANYQGQVGQYNAKMGQLGALQGTFMPAASFMGFGVNPSAGSQSASKGMGNA